jgi:aconitate decarboxylase
MLAAEQFARHAIGTRFEDLPADAVAQAKTFILDTFGVGVAGSTALGAEALVSATAHWGAGGDCTIWGRSERATASAAALINGFQVHCQEFDCLHEAAVLHPLATLLPAALAYAERIGGVSGRELITAVAVGVDVAISLGVASKVALRFFRPATSGGFGAVAAVGRLAGLDVGQMVSAFGLQYAQSSGTMQSHTEGSVALPLQIGFNARAALHAVDLVQAGIDGPRDVFEGPFGYLRLFEGDWDLAPSLDALGRTWRIAELSHKPYPSGRATHGGVEGILALQAAYGFAAADVASVRVIGPPLIHHLCGRADQPNPSPNYARLCMAYVGAKALQHGMLDLAHYRGDALTDPVTHALAQRVVMEPDDNPDPNAMAPQRVVVRLVDGREFEWHCEAMLAHPTRRLSRKQHLAKFRRCWGFARNTLATDAAETLIDLVDRLEKIADVRELLLPLPGAQRHG